MSESELKFHRKVARECFNEAWTYLDKKDRGEEDDRRMLHLAHTSRFHWNLAGNPENVAVGDWQISRAYAALKQPEPALLFAKSAMDICEKNGLSEMLISAYEGMARAYAISKDYGPAKSYLKKARKQLADSRVDDEDRKIFSDQIRETEEIVGR